MYFESNAIYSELTRYSQTTGDAIVRTAPTFWREVAAKRLINPDVSSSTVKRKIRDTKRRVLQLSADCVTQIVTGDGFENAGIVGIDGITASNTQLIESNVDYWLERFPT